MPPLHFTHRASFGTQGEGDTHGLLADVAKSTLADLEKTFPTVFQEPQYPVQRPGLTVDFEHKIDKKDESADPPKRKIYPLDPEEMDELRKQIEALLSDGRIRVSKLPYGAPILFAKKKNGKLRMCIDYR